MLLNCIAKSGRTGVRYASLALVVLSAFALPGCISSTAPILGDAKAILGEQFEMHMYSHVEGALRSEGVATLQWNGSRYAVRGRSDKVGDFTVHAFEGRDLIVQTAPAPRSPKPVEYALARRLADGVYMVIAIDEEVADEATRAKFCTKTQDAACRITTPEQLFVFARATADNADGRQEASIAVLVPSARR